MQKAFATARTATQHQPALQLAATLALMPYQLLSGAGTETS